MIYGPNPGDPQVFHTRSEEFHYIGPQMPPLHYLPDKDEWINLTYVINFDRQSQQVALDHRHFIKVLPLTVTESDDLHAALTRWKQVLENPPTITVVQSRERPEGVNWDLIERAFDDDDRGKVRQAHPAQPD